MDITKEEEKRAQFRELLKELANKQDLLMNKAEKSKICLAFEDIYKEDESGVRFRHFYSDIFLVLSDIKTGKIEGDVSVLGQNILAIRQAYYPQNNAGTADGGKIDVYGNIKKLYDHVSLEVARLDYADATDQIRIQESKIDIVQRRVRNINLKVASLVDTQEKIKETVDSFDEVKNKIDSTQKEYISILGIFASIVITFTTATTFSASILENIGGVSIYRLLITVLIIGLILINAIYGLFFYIHKLVKKQDDVSLEPLKYINIIIICFIVVIVLAWIFGLVEMRNKFV